MPVDTLFSIELATRPVALTFLPSGCEGFCVITIEKAAAGDNGSSTFSPEHTVGNCRLNSVGPRAWGLVVCLHQQARRAVALELATTGITVNAVCPGFTGTDLLAGSIDTIMRKTARSRDEALAELAKHNPQGRLVTPAEVADTVLWLCGDGASAVTGQAIAVAGGEI